MQQARRRVSFVLTRTERPGAGTAFAKNSFMPVAHNTIGTLRCPGTQKQALNRRRRRAATSGFVGTAVQESPLLSLRRCRAAE